MKKKKYIVTAALPYANGPIHIGHLSAVYIPADLFVRFLRYSKQDVLFISGSDEYGACISIKSIKEKTSAQNIINKYHKLIKKTLDKFQISFDNYSRTSNQIHHQISHDFFIKLVKTSSIQEQESYQYYDKYSKEFLADRYIIGTCYNCKNKEAYGDQCEKCGISIIPEELINPKSTINNKKVILKKTKNFYLLLNKYQSFIEKWVKSKKKIWKKNVYCQVMSWIKKGLKSRAITRDLKWGIKIPIKKYENKVLYVWFEAPIGYISSTIEWAIKNNKNWKKYWKNKETSLIQFIGKDNIIFHCIIFPIMLKSYGDDFILPYNIPANEFMNLENKKISTSKNWAIWGHDFLKEFPHQQDSLRYYLVIIMPENKDNNFKWMDFKNRVNAELINILGNFINRVVSICKKYNFLEISIDNKFAIKNQKISLLINQYPEDIKKLLKNYKFRESMQKFIELARIGNKFINDQKPWKIYKNQKKVNEIIYILSQISLIIIKLSYIFLPKTYNKLKLIFNITNNVDNDFQFMKNHKINKKKIILFKKITNEMIEKQTQKLL